MYFKWKDSKNHEIFRVMNNLYKKGKCYERNNYNSNYLCNFNNYYNSRKKEINSIYRKFLKFNNCYANIILLYFY